MANGEAQEPATYPENISQAIRNIVETLGRIAQKNPERFDQKVPASGQVTESITQSHQFVETKVNQASAARNRL